MGPLRRFTLLAFLAGCGGAATSDGGVDGGRLDAAVADAAVADDAGCVLTAPAATLPMVNGTVRIEGGDAGVLPTPAGGDPEGRWLIDDATLWLPRPALASCCAEWRDRRHLFILL